MRTKIQQTKRRKGWNAAQQMCFVSKVTRWDILKDQLLYCKPFCHWKLKPVTKSIKFQSLRRSWMYWTSMGTRMKLLDIQRIFGSILFSLCREAQTWACGCQAPPEVTLSEPVKPEINHSQPSKTALHRLCDWAIWASAHCLHLSLWTI